MLPAVRTQASDISSACTHLWSDSTGTSWAGSVHAHGTLTDEGMVLDGACSYSSVYSSLSAISGSADVVTLSASLCGNYAGIGMQGLYCASSDISVNADHHYYNTGITMSCASVSLPLFLSGRGIHSSVIIAPFFSAGTSLSGSGSFYWFYGKPSVPYSCRTGIAASFYGWNCSLSAGTLAFDIDSNEDACLVRASCQYAGATADTDISAGPWTFRPSLGYTYAYGTFSGTLTADTQQYMLYPYDYYKADGYAAAHILSAGFGCTYAAGSWKFGIRTGAVFFMSQSGSYTASWKYKQSMLFDGSTGTRSGTLDMLDTAGCIAATPSCSIDAPARNGHVHAVISKTFIIPFTFRQAGCTSGSGGSTSDASVIDSSTVISWLFSGITFSASIML